MSSRASQPTSKIKAKQSRGVRYERVDGVEYVGKAAASRLIAAGIAVRDESRVGFSIRQRFKPCDPTGKRFVVRESWGERYQSFALVNPRTNQVVASVHAGERRQGLGRGEWIKVEANREA